MGGILARGVLVLQAGREGQADQRLLPLVGQGGVVAVAAAQDDSAELRDDAQGVLQNFRARVVAVDQYGDAGF